MSMGINKKLQAGQESTYGTKASTLTDSMSYLSESFKFDVEKKAEDSLMVSKTVNGYQVFKYSTSGDFNGILKPDNVGFLLKQALKEPSNPTLKAATTGVYKHSFVGLDIQDVQSSATYTIDRGATVKAYTGCLLDSLKLDSSAGDFVKYTASFKGKDEVAGTINSGLTNPSKDAFVFTSATISVGGASLTKVSDFSFSYSNALDEGTQTNGTGMYASMPLHGEKAISIDLTAEYDSATETIREDNFKAGAYAEVILTFTSPDTIETDEPYTVTITMPKVSINTADANVSGKDRIVIKLSGVATENGGVEPLTVDYYSEKTAKY